MTPDTTPDPLTPFQARVLIVACATPLSGSDLQTEAGLSGTVGPARREAYNDLVARGYFTEHPVPAPGHGTLYAITRAGEACANEVYEDMQAGLYSMAAPAPLPLLAHGTAA